MQKVSQLDNKLQADPILCLEKEMATHSNILAWRIPQTEEPGRLQSMGSPRVRDDSDFHFLSHSSKQLKQETLLVMPFSIYKNKKD